MTRFELLHEVAHETAALPPGALTIEADSAAAAERLWRSWESWLHTIYFGTLAELVGDVAAQAQFARFCQLKPHSRDLSPLGVLSLPARQADLVERWTEAACLLDSTATTLNLWASARRFHHRVLGTLLPPLLVNTLCTLISAVAGAHGLVAYSARRVEALLDVPVEWVAYEIATGRISTEEFEAAVEVIHTGLDKIELELLRLTKE